MHGVAFAVAVDRSCDENTSVLCTSHDVMSHDYRLFGDECCSVSCGVHLIMPAYAVCGSTNPLNIADVSSDIVSASCATVFLSADIHLWLCLAQILQAMDIWEKLKEHSTPQKTKVMTRHLL